MSDAEKLSRDIESIITDAGAFSDGPRRAAGHVTGGPARQPLQDRAIAVVDYANPERIYPFTTF